MKTVGKQLQEARLARNWTPELAARETKIKVERVRDLEADDYSHFTSPTYARGFVRTYARALGLDEYRILRQLDNKLPDDDSANIVTDTGVAYLPETAMPPRAAHRDFTGLYIVMALGGVVMFVITVVLFEAYRGGELSSWFASSSEPIASAVAATNAAPIPPGPTETVARALPVDSNTPPPIVDATTNVTSAPAVTNVPVATVANVPGVSPRALPVDPSLLGSSSDTNSATVAIAPLAEPIPPRALPVDPSELTNAPAATPTARAANPAPVATPASPEATASAPELVAPRALPVDPSELTNGASATPVPSPLVAMNGAASANGTDGTYGTNGTYTAPAPVPSPPSSSARQSDSGPVTTPSLPPVEPPSTAPVATSASTATSSPAPPTNQAAPPSDPAPQVAGDPDANADKRLVLTASQDSFVRVTNVDDPTVAKPLYAAVLHTGQSVGFDGKKFSINVGVPAAVDIKLDGVNYGPHDDQNEPETFTVESHLP